MTGLCALVSLIVPAQVVPVSSTDLKAVLQIQPHQRDKLSADWHGEKDPTYIDAIGIPQGVPDE